MTELKERLLGSLEPRQGIPRGSRGEPRSLDDRGQGRELPLGGRLPGMTVDWAFLPAWRLEFKTEDRFNRYAAYGYSFSTYSSRTWGLMLFREWTF